MQSEEVVKDNGEKLEKGDWIVHKQHGVGQVEAIEEKKIAGEGRKYFRINVSDGIYWLPIKKAPDYIRSISSRYRIRMVLKSIREEPQDLPENYKARNQHVLNKLAEEKIQIKGELIRDLHARGANESVNLTVIDSRQLDKLREQFLREVVVVLGIEMSKAEEKLDKALRKSIENMKAKMKDKKEEVVEELFDPFD